MIWTLNKKLKSLSKKLQGKSILEEKAHQKKELHKFQVETVENKIQFQNSTFLIYRKSSKSLRI
jgi:hypothetical protein